MKFLKNKINISVFGFAMVFILLLGFLSVPVATAEEGVPLIKDWGDIFYFLFLTVLTIAAYMVPLILAFFIYSLVLRWGLKLLKITKITRRKINVFILVILLLNFILNFAIPNIAENKISGFLGYPTNILISFLIIFLFLRYYFSLSSKKLGQLFLYLAIVTLAFSGIATLLQRIAS